MKKLQTLTKAAPISGAPTPAINAPQQAQRQAVRGRRPQQAPPLAAPVGASPPQPSYHAQIAAIFTQLAQETNDPLIQEYAARAQAQASS